MATTPTTRPPSATSFSHFVDRRMSAPAASATASMAFVGLFMPSTTLCLPAWTSASCQMGPKHSMFMPSCSMIQSHAGPDMSSWFMRNFSSME